jgi:hypothetical protein
MKTVKKSRYDIKDNVYMFNSDHILSVEIPEFKDGYFGLIIKSLSGNYSFICKEKGLNKCFSDYFDEKTKNYINTYSDIIINTKDFDILESK